MTTPATRDWSALEALKWRWYWRYLAASVLVAWSWLLLEYAGPRTSFTWPMVWTLWVCAALLARELAIVLAAVSGVAILGNWAEGANRVTVGLVVIALAVAYFAWSQSRENARLKAAIMQLDARLSDLER